MLRLASILIAVLALALAGCGSDDDAEPAAEEPAASEQAAGDEPDEAGGADDAGADEESEEREQHPGTAIATSDSQFGEVLFDADDQAIYYFDVEEGPEPECYGSCAEAWPPVLTRGEPRARGDVRQRLLDTTERRDGSLQVTYDGRPLYYYADEAPGELRCHNIFHEGGLWLAVQPDGDPVPHDPAQTVNID